ncbi:MAG: hypothetical protein K0S31_1575 [Sphingobacterium multivorum]|jgi:hypothetical protein|nr:hypothetical protein [Sphingobacterium multivorum]
MIDEKFMNGFLFEAIVEGKLHAVIICWLMIITLNNTKMPDKTTGHSF